MTFSTLFVILIIVIAIICFFFNNFFYSRRLSDPQEIERCSKGREYMKRCDLVVTSLLRDAMPSFEHAKRTVEMLTSRFRHVKVIILENDSVDGTRTEWLKYAKNHGFNNLEVVLIGCGVNAEVCTYGMMKTLDHGHTPKRIQKMIHLRNEMMDYLSTLKFNENTFWFNTDLDIKGWLYEEGVENTFSYFADYPHIEAIGCRGTSKNSLYFDPYAYSDVDIDPLNDVYVAKPLLGVRYMTGLQKVTSTFSGGVFYRLPLPHHSSLMKYSYRETSSGEAVCEHVTFHTQFFNEIYINTNMIFDVNSH